MRTKQSQKNPDNLRLLNILEAILSYLITSNTLLTWNTYQSYENHHLDNSF